jgi:hypothetical protein
MRDGKNLKLEQLARELDKLAKRVERHQAKVQKFKPKIKTSKWVSVLQAPAVPGYLASHHGTE